MPRSPPVRLSLAAAAAGLLSAFGVSPTSSWLECVLALLAVVSLTTCRTVLGPVALAFAPPPPLLTSAADLGGSA
eukprot:3319570-Amphidinium_carterae.1